MRTFALPFHRDDAHGWLEVPKSLVKDLGVTVSPWSYQKDDKYFLEEDCDAETFMQAARDAKISFATYTKSCNGLHKIRNYERVNDPNWVSPFMQQ